MMQIHHTNYPELKVIIDSEAPAIDIVQTQINMDLELWMDQLRIFNLQDRGITDVKVEVNAVTPMYSGTEQPATDGTLSVPYALI